MLRYDLRAFRSGWRKQPLEERIGIVSIVGVSGLWALAITAAILH